MRCGPSDSENKGNEPWIAHHESGRRAIRIWMIVALIGAAAGGYLFGHSNGNWSFDTSSWTDPAGLSKEFREKATAAYITLGRMDYISPDEPAYLTLQFDVERALTEANPVIRTEQDAVCYRILKQWIRSNIEVPALQQQFEEMPQIANRMKLSWYASTRQFCPSAASIYFEPQARVKESYYTEVDPSTGKERKFQVLSDDKAKRECLMTEADYTRRELALSGR